MTKATEAENNIKYTRDVQEKTDEQLAKELKKPDASRTNPISDADKVRLRVFSETPDPDKITRTVKENLVDPMQDQRLRELMRLRVLAEKA